MIIEALAQRLVGVLVVELLAGLVLLTGVAIAVVVGGDLRGDRS